MSRFAHLITDALSRVATTDQQRAVILEGIAHDIGSSRTYVDALFAGEADPTDYALVILTQRLPVTRNVLEAVLRRDALDMADQPYFDYGD